MNNPARTFSKMFLYIWFNLSIDLIKYIISVALINNRFCFWVRIKDDILCCITTFYFFFFLNSITNLVTNLKHLNSAHACISLFLIADLVSLRCSSRLKKIQNSNIIRTCITFISMRLLRYFSTFFVQITFTICLFTIQRARISASTNYLRNLFTLPYSLR